MNTLKVILYFSLFKYPLTKEEMFAFSNVDKIEDVEIELNTLLERKIVFKVEKYFSKTNDIKLLERRLKGNKMAEEIMPIAYKKAKLIMKFPFVKSVSISGSLSKNYYDDNGDIDFFIITEPNYLWLGRSLLIAYKKLFLLNSKKHFCVNYFISSSNLEIKEQNRFTATEIATLKPIYGEDLFRDFIDENKWYTKFYPNKMIDYNSLRKDIKKPSWSLFIEFIFRNKLGKIIDIRLKNITVNKWKSKFRHLRKREFNVAMKSTNDVSKHHPQDFQSKVIKQLNKKYIEQNKAHNLNLILENA